MARRKIVFVSGDGGGGGIWRYSMETVEALSKVADVSFLIADPFAGQGNAKANCDSTLPVIPRLSAMIETARFAWKEAEALEPDIVELGDWPLGFVPAVLKQTIPYIVQCHGSIGQIAEHDPLKELQFENSMAQLIEPALLAKAHRVQSLSRSNANFWSEMTGRPVQMIRPAFRLPDLPGDLGVVSEAAAVFGRLQRWKGPHILCEALRLLEGRAPLVDWYGGMKPWEAGHQSTGQFLAKAYPDVWGTKLRHYGTVPRPTVAQIQAKAVFNIVPSTWDVFNFTAVESMAAARPTFVSTGAGASELIVDGENGFLFANESPESLAAAIDQVMSMPEKRRREVGKAGRETVLVELDPAKIAAQRLAAYEEAIQSFAASPPPRPNTWLANFIDPALENRLEVEDLLELYPIRIIGRHLKDRTLRKLHLSKSS